MIRVFTDSTVNRRKAIENELDDDNCVFYYPKVTDYWFDSYKNIKKFLQDHQENKVIALIFPETSLGRYGIPLLALNYFTDSYSKDKIIYVVTDSLHLFDWMRCSVFLELLNYDDVEIFHEGVLYLNEKARLSDWPDDMLPNDWPQEILLSPNINVAKKTLEFIKQRWGMKINE
jgi:hypothetical protein